MTESGLRRDVDNLMAAVGRLQEALEIGEDNPLAVDGTIQRFEFTYELTWKSLKRLLEARGLRKTTPRDVFRSAYQAGMLDDEAIWLDLIAMRNLSSHTYNEQTAKQVYAGVRESFPVLRATADRIRQLADEDQTLR